MSTSARRPSSAAIACRRSLARANRSSLSCARRRIAQASLDQRRRKWRHPRRRRGAPFHICPRRLRRSRRSRNGARRPSVGPHDFARGISARLPEALPPRNGGPHDFSRGLAPRGYIPSVGVPPHARAVPGRGHNRLMNRSRVTPLASTSMQPRETIASTAAPRGQAFTRNIYDAARRAGIPETQARLAAAQAAHESDYGRRAPDHNYFGVKGVGTAGSQLLRTHEQGRRGLYATKGRFARYAAPEDSLKHWWAKIQRQWPQAAGASNFRRGGQGPARRPARRLRHRRALQ